MVRRIEGLARSTGALQLGLVEDIEARRLFAEDGHRSARAFVQLAANLSSAESGRRAKAARMLRAMPAIAAGLRSGRLGVSQVDRIARVHANPRVRDQLEAVDRDLAIVAERLRYDELDRYLARWEHLADEDGAADDAARGHARRDFTIRQTLDGTYRLAGACGSLQGAVTADVLEAYARAEREADWAEARARVGEAATVEDLCRTEAQRRMDAVERIFADAAGALAERTGHQIVTDLVMDQQTFERAARRLCGDEPGPDPRLETWWSDLASFLDEPPEGRPGRTGTSVGPATRPRSETLDGQWVDPAEAAAVALVGRVRRAVMGADGVVLDVGRTQRFFTGARRLAVLLSLPDCSWLACTVRAQDCEVDHLTAWDDGGRTDPGNGAPACGKHNRFRNHGFTVRRDAAGRLHVHRPDGTAVT